jgi:hypothetical protein
MWGFGRAQRARPNPHSSVGSIGLSLAVPITGLIASLLAEAEARRSQGVLRAGCGAKPWQRPSSL